MRFEERVTALCAQALAAHDDGEVRTILGELRLVLHQHIQELRSGLLTAYAPTMIRPVHDTPLGLGAKTGDTAGAQPAGVPRTWEQVVHEIARETDHGRTLQLSLELTALLQRQGDTASQS